MARSLDVAPAHEVAHADVGIGRGWEVGALLGTTLLLVSFGLVTLYSATPYIAQRAAEPDHYFVLRQATGAAAGLAALGILAWLPYQIWQHAAWPLLAGVWILLVILILPGTESIAPSINGARRWLRVGVSFQPSELAKLAIIIWTASMAVRKQDKFKSLRRGLLPFLVVWGLVLLPIAMEPDLSTTLIVAALGSVIVYAAGARVAHFVFLGIAALPVLALQLAADFRVRRVLAFMDPSSDPSGAGFQVQQSMIAMGSGGITGVGFGQGQQEFGFLPEVHTDFIFAMIGEEWGFLGVLFTVCLFGLLVLIGFRVASRAPDFFGQLLGVGLTSMIGLQAVLHMAVGMGMVPATGVPLPLISYGRSNILVTLAAVGILMSIARTSERRYFGGDRA